jgi:hypothetical protein
MAVAYTELTARIRDGEGWYRPEPEREEACAKLAEDWGLPGIPTPKQSMLLNAPGRTMRQPVLYGGAMGAARTAGIVLWGISKCLLVPSNRVLLCRQEFSTFRTSTLQELEAQIADMPGVRHSPGNHEVYFPNKSELWYMGVGKPAQRSKLGSTQFGAIGIDEAHEVGWDVFKMLQTRLRWQPAAEANELQIALTANPYPGWIRTHFISQPKKGWQFIPAKLSDNPHMYAGYEEDMRESMDSDWVEAFIEGDWFAWRTTSSPSRLR